MLEHSIQSKDGTRLRIVQWAPEGEPRAEVFLQHGLAEHAGRYGHVAQALVEAGYRVTFLELRGHGKSGGDRSRIDRWSDYIEDLQAGLDFVRKPVLMVAHSMGGLVALDALRSGAIAGKVQALVISNPLTGLAVVPPLYLELSKKVLSRLLPGLHIKNPMDPKTISRDAEVVRAYEADPMVFDTLTARWATEMEAAMERVQAHAARFDVPVLAMLGTGDQICDHLATKRLVDGWGHKTHDVKLYEGLYHEIFNEPEQQQVIADLVAWLDSRETP